MTEDALPPSPAEGTLIDDRFELREELGAGAMGRVFRVRDRVSGADRALKVIGLAGMAAAEDARARFRREALAMSRLQHPGIARIIEFGTLPDDSYFLVMEYIRGEDLQRRVEADGPLSLRAAVEVLGRVAEAVAYAQGQGIVHRDLKPANVLIPEVDQAQAKIIDYGLAKLLTDEQLTQLTADEQLLGTPIFMSPEQCLCQEVGAAVDVYALAGIAYYIISGVPVFMAETVPKVILAQVYEPPKRLSERCPELGIPEALDTLLLDCLLKDPTARPLVADVAARLRALLPQVGMAAGVSPAAAVPGMDLQATVLDHPEVLASSLWLTVPETDPSGAGSRSALQDALFNQITDQVLFLTERLQGHLGPEAGLLEVRSRVEALGEQITEVEMDLALLEAEGDEEGVPAYSEQQEALRGRIYELKVEQNRQYRSLFQSVVRYQDEATEPSIRAAFAELETLIREFLEAGRR